MPKLRDYCEHQLRDQVSRGRNFLL